MTNTLYFHSVKRDAYSTCSSSSSLQSPHASQRHTGAKSTVRSRVKAFRVSSILGFKQKVVKDDVEIIQLPHHQRSYSLEFMKFSFEEITTATGNLLNEHVLNVDGCDREFKGWIGEPEKSVPIVIKLIDSREEYEDREDEARYLGQLSHPNLVKFYGYCSYKEHQLFVFEPMPRKLEDHLFKSADLLLPWSLRMKVALGVAKGLAFLHRAQVIYREFSTSIILLDAEYNAKLSDFGIPKDCLMDDKSRSSSDYESHFASGYVATGHQTTKIDVYSFGMLLLEIISGRQSSEFEKQVQTKFGSSDKRLTYKDIASEFVERGMVNKAWPYLKDKISYIVDHRLKGHYSRRNAEKVANLALKCLDTEATLRPDMDQVATELEQLQDSEYTKFIKLEHKAIGFEQFLDSRDTGRHQNEEETESEEVMHEEQSSDINMFMAAIMEEDSDMAAIMEEERESMLLDGR
ncbi:hypothetical protein ACHQM5_021317 [Ranunculus cassubicifolius]